MSVTGLISDNELIDKILVMLGVDPDDWSSSLSGIYAAIRSNMQIGESISNVYDWTDGEINTNSLTEVMFKLLERSQRAEFELATMNARLETAQSLIDQLRRDEKRAQPVSSDHKLRALREALEEIESEAGDAQSEWCAVDLVYAPEWTHPYKAIVRLAAIALKAMSS